MMYWTEGSLSWPAWTVMTVSMLAFWGLIAWVAIALVRSRPNDTQAGRSPSPEEILAERFARGEMGEDEYRQRSEALRQQRSQAA